MAQQSKSNLIVAGLIILVIGALLWRAISGWFTALGQNHDTGSLSADQVPVSIDATDLSTWPVFITTNRDLALRYPPNWQAQTVDASQLPDTFGTVVEAWQVSDPIGTGGIQVLVLLEEGNDSLSQIITNCDQFALVCQPVANSPPSLKQLDLSLSGLDQQIFALINQGRIYLLMSGQDADVHLPIIIKTLTTG